MKTNEELIAELQQQLADQQATNAKLEKNQTEQNKYITKLEEAKNGYASQLKAIQETAAKPSIDPTVAKFFEGEYVEKVIIKAKMNLRALGKEKNLSFVEKELDAWLKQHATKTNISEKFVHDAYTLILGRAIDNPEHPINKQESTVVQDPVVQPKAEPKVINHDFPTVVTNEDPSGGAPVPRPRSEVKNTREAFKMFEQTLLNQGRNKFE